MAEYFVDSAAAGGGSGTEGSPWNSLSSVEVTALYPGDVVKLKRGSLFREDLILDNSGTAGQKVTFTAYGTGDRPKICGADLKTGWTNESGSLWYVTGCTYYSRIVLFDGTVGQERATKVALTQEYDWWYDDTNDRIYAYSPTDPDTRYTAPGVEAGQNRWGIATDWTSGINHITIQNIHLYGMSGSPAVHSTRSTGWTLDGVLIEKIAKVGIQMRAATDLTVCNSTLTGVRNLNIAGNALHGIHVYAENDTYVGANVHVYNCTITNWPTYGITVGGYSFDHRFVGVYVHDNDLSHNATGVYPGECDTGEIYNNTCDDNLNPYKYEEEYGIAFETVSNFDVHHNTCTNGRCGMEIWAFDGDKEAYPEWWYCGQSNGNKVHHNTFSGNTQSGFLVYMGYVNGLELRHNRSFNNHDGGFALMEVYGTGTGNRVENNTLLGNNIDDGGYADVYWGSACAGWTFKNNVLYNTNRPCLRAGNAALAATHANNAYYRATGNVIENYGTNYTLAQVPNFEATAENEDPDFVSVVTPDLHIKITSPCATEGENLGWTTDFDGNPIPGNTGYSIGAYQAVVIMPVEGYQTQGSDSPAMGVLPPTGPDAVIGTIPVAPFTIPYRTKDPQLNATLERIRHKLNELTDLINENTADIASIQAVVGAAVVDARIDDTINSGDATTDGVIDAMRDALIAHGLIKAS